MLLDKQNLFSDGQAITADAASTNVIDCRGKIKEIAAGTVLPLLIQAVEAFTVTGTVTVEVKLQTDDNEAFSSPKTLATTGAISSTDLVAGYVAPINYIPKGNEGYLRLYYDVTISSGGSITKGKFTAGIVAGLDCSYQDM